MVLDTDALGGLDGAAQRSVRGESVVAPGRHPLAGWLLLGADTDVAPIDAVALTARLARNAQLLGAQPSLSGLAGVLSRLRLSGLREWHREALLAGLERLAR